MVRLGRREFDVPLWLWAAFPLAAVVYATYDYVSLIYRYRSYGFGEPDRSFVAMMAQLGTAYLAAFLLADTARRARTPWYGLPLIYVASIAAAALVVAQGINRSFEGVAQFVVGAAISLAASTRGAGGGAFVLIVITAVVPILLAIGAALFVTIASRLVAGLPLHTRGAWRECWSNLCGAAAWMMIAVGGYLAIRFGYGLPNGISRAVVPAWLPYVGAGCGALAATALHLWLVCRGRRREGATQGQLRIWLLAALCVLALVYNPYLLGRTGANIYYDHVMPALRAVHLLPTPVIAIAGYKIDIPFHDRDVGQGAPHPTGGATFVTAFLPAEYGLAVGQRRPRIAIYRRDVTVDHLNPAWEQRRRALAAAQAQKPGQDAFIRSQTVVPALALRTDAFPELDFELSSFAPAASWETVEETLRRFVQERVRRISE